MCALANGIDATHMRMLTHLDVTQEDYERAADAIKLFTYGFRFFQNTKLFEPNAVLATARVWKGKEKEVKLGV